MTPQPYAAPAPAAPEFITPAGTVNLSAGSNMINEIKKFRADFQTRYGIAMGLKESKDVLDKIRDSQRVAFRTVSFTHAQLQEIMRKVVAVEVRGVAEDTQEVARMLGLPSDYRG